MRYVIKKAVLIYESGLKSVIHYDSNIDNNETHDLKAFKARLKKQFSHDSSNPVVNIRLTYEERERE